MVLENGDQRENIAWDNEKALKDLLLEFFP